MNINQVALQLYTLRDLLDTPANIRRSLRRVAAIGYRAVQANDFAVIPDNELSTILAGEGLQLCATHEDSQTLQFRPEAASEHLHKLGCRHTAYGYPAGVDLSDPAQVAQLARQLDHAGEVLSRAGQVLSYHNHSLEFCRRRAAEPCWITSTSTPTRAISKPSWTPTGFSSAAGTRWNGASGWRAVCRSST